jgi:hypothetical protein
MRFPPQHSENIIAAVILARYKLRGIYSSVPERRDSGHHISARVLEQNHVCGMGRFQGEFRECVIW